MSALLYAENLSFSYTNDAPTLIDISVSLSAGEIVALIGPNGSGKSTLLRALLGQLRATGPIAWNSRSLADWSHRDLAKTVAYLPQSQMWEQDQTVLDILRLGRAPYWAAFGIESRQDAAVIEKVATQLLLQEILSRRLDEISGGQRQRVFIARCLIQQPQAMLLDEPNTFLDLRHQVETCRILRRLADESSLGILFASHDLNLAAAFADRLILLNGGKIVAEGTPDQVLNAKILSEVYGIALERVDAGGRAIVFPKWPPH